MYLYWSDFHYILAKATLQSPVSEIKATVFRNSESILYVYMYK